MLTGWCNMVHQNVFSNFITLVLKRKNFLEIQLRKILFHLYFRFYSLSNTVLISILQINFVIKQVGPFASFSSQYNYWLSCDCQFCKSLFYSFLQMETKFIADEPKFNCFNWEPQLGFHDLISETVWELLLTCMMQ